MSRHSIAPGLDLGIVESSGKHLGTPAVRNLAFCTANDLHLAYEGFRYEGPDLGLAFETLLIGRFRPSLYTTRVANAGCDLD